MGLGWEGFRLPFYQLCGLSAYTAWLYTRTMGQGTPRRGGLQEKRKTRQVFCILDAKGRELSKMEEF